MATVMTNLKADQREMMTRTLLKIVCKGCGFPLAPWQLERSGLCGLCERKAAGFKSARDFDEAPHGWR